MCYYGCLHENWYGECKAQPLDGLYPCDKGYDELKEQWEGERDAAVEARAEERAEELREERIAAQKGGITGEDS